MSLPQEFWKDLAERSDEQLYDMLAHADDYVPEALEAVREELRKRDLPPERAAELEVAAQQKLTGEQQKAKEPLSWILKVVMFLLCATCVGIWCSALLYSYYKSKGCTKKASQCWAWFIWGLVIWPVLLIILALLIQFAR